MRTFIHPFLYNELLIHLNKKHFSHRHFQYKSKINSMFDNFFPSNMDLRQLVFIKNQFSLNASGLSKVSSQECYSEKALFLNILEYNKQHQYSELKEIKMKAKFSKNSIIEQQKYNTVGRSNDKKVKGFKKPYEISKNQNISSCSMVGSTFKNILASDQDQVLAKPEDAQFLGMTYFTQKYLLRDDSQDNLKEQMKLILSRKKNQIQSLRIYRDELKFISRNNAYNQSIKLSVQTLKQKAEAEQKLTQYRAVIEKDIKNADRQLEILNQYQKFMANFLQAQTSNINHDYLDISKEEEVMLKNLQHEKDMLIRELAQEQRKNSKQIKGIQDQILMYRIMIKQKEDNLRNLKAKICTLYIKLHSRNNSRTGSKSKDRNMSLSIKKFNNQNHSDIKQAYIGNNTFKSYSKQIIEKVSAEEQLIKIKFFISSTVQSNQPGNKNREQLFFQCFYKGRDGQIHQDRIQEPSNDDDATRDKISQTTQKFEQVYVKYLFSMKFFYKSKIVGVECRIKTDKGNKHINIGNCNPNIQHELLTLVNKKIVTLGSYWHGKQMIGISVWYSEKLKNPSQFNKKNQDQEKKIKLKQQSYDEYYS